MNYKKQIQTYKPINEQEVADQAVLLRYLELFPHNILLRDNTLAHLTSSGFIMNKELTKVLMVHHNIYNTWSWTGGHADGEEDLLYVAIKEAKEETGIKTITPLSTEIASLDILPVWGHIKNGKYIATHMHLSVAYLLIADENEALVVKEDENSGVKWVACDELSAYSNEPKLVEIYNKLIFKAHHQ